MVDRRKKMHREILEQAVTNDKLTLPSFIPYSSIVERMGVERSPVAHFSPRSGPGQAFGVLWDQVDDVMF